MGVRFNTRGLIDTYWVQGCQEVLSFRANQDATKNIKQENKSYDLKGNYEETGVLHWCVT